MIIFHYPVFKINADRIWFSDGEPVESKAQILRYMRIPVEADRFSGRFVSRDYNDTLIHDLQESEENIWKRFSKTYRYDINRGKKDEGVSFEVFDEAYLASEAGSEILDGMREAYLKLFEQKENLGMHNNYRQDEMDLFVAANAVIITRATCADAQVWHMYLADGETAILYHSASNFRSEEIDQNLVGRMNKLLHWKDMMLLKERGYHYYDWGNCSGADKEHATGIDLFKLNFGGERVHQVSVFVGNRFFGKLAVFARRIVHKG